MTLRAASGRPTTSFHPDLEPLESRLVPSMDPILEWNAVALDAVAADHTFPGGTQTGPTRTARALAIVHAAMYDAFNSIDQSYTPYLLAVPNARGADPTAAVAQAGYDTLAALYPGQTATFQAALTRSLMRVMDGPKETLGVAVGHATAAAILAARANDGSAASMPYTPTNAISHWQPDPQHPTQTALTPGWGKVTPFAVTAADQFPVAPPPDLTNSEYTRAYSEVKALGGDGVVTATQRTAEQTTIGIFWGYDGSPGLGTPPRLYNQIVRRLARMEGNDVAENARLFALTNLAMADAGICCWDAKYDYDFWRPVTAIRAGDADGNRRTDGDATWTPLGAPADNGGGTNFTPPFPAYTSGHATFGAAMFRTLRDFFGTDRMNFTVASDEFNGVTRDQNGNVRPVVFRSFQRFSDAAEENGQSRIYLGIHWAFDKTEGIRQGNAVADWVFNNFLRPRDHDDDHHGHQAALALALPTPPIRSVSGPVAAPRTGAFAVTPTVQVLAAPVAAVPAVKPTSIPTGPRGARPTTGLAATVDGLRLGKVTWLREEPF